MEMKKITVKNLIDSDLATSNEKGKILKKEILNSIEQKTPVVIDFSNIKILTSAFLNPGIGEVYSELGEDKFFEYVSLDKSTSELQKDKFNLVLENIKYKRSDDFYEKKEGLLHGQDC